MPPAVATQRILTLDAATARCSAGLVADGVALGVRHADDVTSLPSMVAELLAAHGRDLDLVAVTVGPGSFTGLRASIALAHGIGLAAGAPVIGVTVGTALASAHDATYWTAIDSKRGRVFLERDGAVDALAIEAVPVPPQPIVLGGDAALAVGEVLAAGGASIRLDPATAPSPVDIARAATTGPTRPAVPLYVEPPAARPGPPGRPAPA